MAETNLSYAAVAANNNNNNSEQQNLSQEELPPSDNRNYRLQTVVLDRPYTATFGCRDGQIPLDAIMKYFEQIKIVNDIKCINNIAKNDKETVLEITFKDFATQFADKIEETKMKYQNLNFTQLDNRQLKDVKIQPLIRVMIYEAPYELENQHIYNKLRMYGEVADQLIYMHKYKDTGILNGVRSMTFLKINKPIPTTLFVKGNLIKLRHNGQDRTPFCTICKTKGHYRLECPGLNNRNWEDPIMDWAQEVETREAAETREEQQTGASSNSESLATSPGGKQQNQQEKAVNDPQKNIPQGGKQQTSSEKSDSNTETSIPDQEWQEIKHKNKSTKRNTSNSQGLTQIMGEIFTQEPKSASKRKNKTKIKSGKKTKKTELEYNKYSSSSSFDASDERSSESSSDESTITESTEN